MTFFQIFEWIGTAAFAVSGAMVAIENGMDLFGVLFLAGITALGGGTLRDVLLGNLPPNMFSNYRYLLLAAICALIVFSLAKCFKEKYLAEESRVETINNFFDAMGLGIFAVSGARICIECGYGHNLFMVTFLGMTTAIGGGMLRDIMIHKTPMVLEKHIYAVAAIVGALVYGSLIRLNIHSSTAFGIGFVCTFVLRILATIFRWNLPKAL